MFDPNPIQAKLLKAVQNLASDNAHLIDQSRTRDNQQLSPMALAHLDIGRRTRENLEAIATAVGVPKSVIDYTRASGERGHRWQPGQPLLSTEAIDRDTLLRGHLRAVAQLQTMAGVGAAFSQQGTLPRDGFAAFRRVMGVTWQRVGAVGHGLVERVQQVMQACAQLGPVGQAFFERAVGFGNAGGRCRFIVHQPLYL